MPQQVDNIKVGRFTLQLKAGQVRIIGGKWRGRILPVVSHSPLRPTPDRVRETLFNWLMNDVAQAVCLDLFAGTGVLGFEALSRGAKQVTFVENMHTVMAAIKANAIKLSVQAQTEVILNDAMQWLATITEKTTPFDIIFLDPPFASSLLVDVLSQLSNSHLVTKNTLIYLEAPKLWTASDLPAGWQLLKQKVAGEVYYHLLQGADRCKST